MIAAIFATVLFALSWLRHHNFWSGFDLAIFDQASWQLSRGSDFVSIMDRRVLADHVSPVLYLFAPLYRIVATPLWLLGAQAAALGARVVPVRALARHLGASVPLATFLTLASAPILAAGLFDFHASTLAVPFVAAALCTGVWPIVRGWLGSPGRSWCSAGQTWRSPSRQQRCSRPGAAGFRWPSSPAWAPSHRSGCHPSSAQRSGGRATTPISAAHLLMC